MRLSLAYAATFLFKTSLAVFADEAWSIDYHHALLGEPKEDTTFFHRPNPASPAALIYTFSERGVLGAVNPRDGSTVWRQRLASGDLKPNATFLRAGEGQDVVIGGIGNQVSAWSAGDGRLVWDLDLGGAVEDLEILELPDGQANPQTKDAVLLSSGADAAVRRVDGATGHVKWQHILESGDTPYQLSVSATDIYAILLHKTMLGYVKVKVVTLDPVDGRKTEEYTLSSESELSATDTVAAVGANSASPIIAWTDAAHTVLKVNIIGTKSVLSFNIGKHDDLAIEKVRIHAPYHTNSLPHFLVHYETSSSHWADIFHIDLKKSTIKKAYSLPEISGKGAFSTSTSDANVYFTRITDDEVSTVSSVSHGVLGRWAYKIDGLHPIHAVSEVSVKGDKVAAIRSAVLFSNDNWTLLREGKLIWNRLECLAGTISATFATSSPVEAFARQLKIEVQSSFVLAYIHRLTRHFAELQSLPTTLASLPQRFMQGFLGTSADGDIENDVFGFHKIIACLTDKGRVIALDAGDPSRILWSRKLMTESITRKWRPMISATEDGAIFVPQLPDTSLNFPILNATTGKDTTVVNLDDSQNTEWTNVSYTILNGVLEASWMDLRNPPRLLWDFKPANGEQIHSLQHRPINDPVASIGKVLGDRRVLYKYLDPNIALLVTVNDAASTASFYLLNTVSGATLFSTTHTGLDLTAPISSIVSENWFAYSYTAEASESSSKGQFLVAGELFESLVPNDRGPLSGSSNFSSLNNEPEPFTMTKSYQIPESISKLAVTQTRQGITSRQLIAILPDSNSIVGIPYLALDPRRPANRDPTKDEQAEGLARYAPVIEFDPKWYLNHQRELLGMEEVVTTPALLESTSLVFAYGLDIFGTRLSPSFSFDILGKGFNKFQMLATVAGLAAATFVVAPLVTRKQVNTRWQFT